MKKKVVLITGASSGIGKQTARTLIEKGYKVYAVARRVEKMEDLKELGGISLKMDLTNRKEIEAVVKKIKSNEGKIDILINNAGYATQGPIEEVALEAARRMFEVNLFGLAALSKQVIPIMRENQFGKIINISSVAGKVHFALGGWYISTKHALEGWSDSLRVELKPFNIEVVIIEPGAIATEFSEVSLTPLVEKYGKGVYGEKVKAFVNFNRDLEKRNKMAPPSVITKLIVKAIEAKKPKARYVGGGMAKPFLFIRRWSTDSFYDRLIGKLLS